MRVERGGPESLRLFLYLDMPDLLSTALLVRLTVAEWNPASVMNCQT